ncbi:hypothetical protein FLONG3_4527, partial [Fusarium longipes]
MKLHVLLFHLSAGVLAGPCKPYGPVSSTQLHDTIPIPPASTNSVPLSVGEPSSPTQTSSDIFASGALPIGVSQSGLVSSVLSSTLLDDGVGGQAGSQTSENTSAVTEGGDADGVQATMTSSTISIGTHTSDPFATSDQGPISSSGPEETAPGAASGTDANPSGLPTSAITSIFVDTSAGSGPAVTSGTDFPNSSDLSAGPETSITTDTPTSDLDAPSATSSPVEPPVTTSDQPLVSQTTESGLSSDQSAPSDISEPAGHETSGLPITATTSPVEVSDTAPSLSVTSEPLSTPLETTLPVTAPTTTAGGGGGIIGGGTGGSGGGTGGGSTG